MSSMIEPGSMIGMLGSGQLGRMFAHAAQRLGYRVWVYSPDENSPLGQIATKETIAAYDDDQRLDEFSNGVDVVTFEFENVPARTVERVARHAPVRPGNQILEIAQHRIREKSSIARLGIPVPDFAIIRSLNDLEAAIQTIGRPSVLKSAMAGYDGKGQVKIDLQTSLSQAWSSLQTDEAILEAFVTFQTEFSMIGARGIDGAFVSYGPIENRHDRHILDVSMCPVRFPKDAISTATDALRTIMSQFEVVGVLCVEFFLTTQGKVLVNEIAPRPHNSGHLTIEAFECSQFEQQVRAICGLPLGQTEQLKPAAMVNLLGDVWTAGQPNWDVPLTAPHTYLHLYGKAEAREGRKMGHITVLADDCQTAANNAQRIRQQLSQ